MNLSGDAMITVLCMVRAMLNSESAADKQLPTWLKEYPVTLTQVRFKDSDILLNRQLYQCC